MNAVAKLIDLSSAVMSKKAQEPVKVIQLKQNTDTVLVYDPTNPDSVIAAAMIAAQEGITRAMPNTDAVFSEDCLTFQWVGVEPSKQTVKHLKDKHHSMLVYIKPDLKLKNITSMVGVKEFSQDPDLPLLRPTLVSYIAKERNEEAFYSKFWELHLALGKMAVCDKQMPMYDQVLVHANYQHAIRGLNEGKPYDLVQPEPEHHQAYLAFLKDIKFRISTIWSIRSTKIDDRMVHIPTLNAAIEMAPWVIKLVSCVYDSVVVYENYRGQTIYTTFDRKLPDAELMVKTYFRNNKECQTHPASRM